MLPDVMQDNVTDAARRLGLDDVHQLFLLISHQRRENDIHGSAQTAFSIWARGGYDALPETIQEFVLRVCEGQYVNEGRTVIQSLC